MHTSIAVYQQKIVAQQTALDYDETTVAFLARKSAAHFIINYERNSLIARLRAKKREKKERKRKKE